jgi:hypothetical protein
MGQISGTKAEERMSDPIEKAFARLCDDFDIRYKRPEKDPKSQSTLDFQLLDYDVSVEVKQFPTERIHDQMVRSGEKNIIVLVGRGSVEALRKLMERS